MAATIRAFCTPWRLTWYPRLLLAALAAALLGVLCTGEGARIATGRLGGDFAEFYGAGRIVASGNLLGLYDKDVQREAQRDLMPDSGPGRDNTFVPYAYPPQVALAYGLIARLPYRAAFIVQTAFSAACLLLAAWLLRASSPPSSRQVLAMLAAMVFYYPVLRALLGGQNTPLAILLVAAAFAASWRGRDWLAGLALGLLLFKPQYGLTLLGLQALGGRWRTLLAGIGAGAIIFLADTLLFGPTWPMRWYAYARWVIDTSMGMEGDKAISCIGALRSLALATGLEIGWIGYALACGVAVVLGLAWLRLGRIGGDAGAGVRQGAAWPLAGLTSAGMVLVAPHAYFYDAGLLLLAFPALAQSRLVRKDALCLALWLAGFTQPLAGPVGLSPLFPVAFVVFGLMAYLVHTAVKDAGPRTAARPGEAAPRSCPGGATGE